MQLHAFLEDFGEISQQSEDSVTLTDIDFEGQKLESFENGYKAGWEDAIKAHADDQNRLASDFTQNLQDLSFTYHEAYSQVLGAMTPLLDQMVKVLLPSLAREALGLHILDQLQEQCRSAGSPTVEVLVSPSNHSAVAKLMEQDFGYPLRLIEDEMLGDGQADIRFGETEQQIDLTSVLEGIEQAVKGFVYENNRKLAHG